MASNKANEKWRMRIYDIMDDANQEQTTHEIHELLKQKFKYAPSMPQLGNLLGKSIHFRKAGFINRSGTRSTVWRMRMWKKDP